jgi:hypothetical protein
MYSECVPSWKAGGKIATEERGCAFLESAFVGSSELARWMDQEIYNHLATRAETSAGQFSAVASLVRKVIITYEVYVLFTRYEGQLVYY